MKRKRSIEVTDINSSPEPQQKKRKRPIEVTDTDSSPEPEEKDRISRAQPTKNAKKLSPSQPFYEGSIPPELPLFERLRMARSIRLTRKQKRSTSPDSDATT